MLITFKTFVSKLTWHNRLGHPADKALNVLKPLLIFDNESVMPCEVCHKAKQSKESFPISEHKSSIIGELIYLYVWAL